MEQGGFIKMKKWIAVLILITISAGFAGCGGLELPFGRGESSSRAREEDSQAEPVDPEYPVTVAGATLAERPGSVVSLAASLTEKLYDLGLEERLAGVPRHTAYPEAATRLPDCGTALEPDMEAILALEPELVVSEADLSRESLDILAEADIQVAVLPRANSVRELLDIYRSLAVLLEGAVTGGELGDDFGADMEDRLDELSAAALAAKTEDVPVLYLRMLDFTIATGDTLEGELMRNLGLVNIAEEYEKWKYPPEEAAGAGREDFAAVQMIFCGEKDVPISALEGSGFYKGLPAVLKDWHIYIDPEIFEAQGLRMLDELGRMALACYPDMAVEEPGLELPVQESEARPEGT